MRVRASSLNYRDLMVLNGGGRGPTKLGVVPLSDGAGEVAAIGDGVTRVKLGDRVIGTFHPRWFGGPLSADYLTDRLGANLDRMLAEYAVFNEEAPGNDREVTESVGRRWACQLCPVIDRTFPFAEAKEAYRHFAVISARS
jgi:NADPH:quinone reductase-like Zn-dependent oxidoreductase